MKRYVAWVKDAAGPPVFVAYRAGSILFVYWYLIRFAGESPFSFSALDMKTYAMALLKTEYRETVKKNMPTAGSTTCRTRMWRSTTRLSKGRVFATCSRKTGRAEPRKEAGCRAITAPYGARLANLGKILTQLLVLASSFVYHNRGPPTSDLPF